MEPYASHVFQLLAYCLLVESTTGQRPPYGILKYRNRTFAIDFTEAQEQALIELMEDIHLDEAGGECDRSHEETSSLWQVWVPLDLRTTIIEK